MALTDSTPVPTTAARLKKQLERGLLTAREYINRTPIDLSPLDLSPDPSTDIPTAHSELRNCDPDDDYTSLLAHPQPTPFVRRTASDPPPHSPFVPPNQFSRNVFFSVPTASGSNPGGSGVPPGGQGGGSGGSGGPGSGHGIGSGSGPPIGPPAGPSGGLPGGQPFGGGGGGGYTPPPTANPSAQLAPWIPPTPLMGGLRQVDHTKFTPWTGGRPKPDWSGLDPNFAKLTRDSNLQDRSLSESAALRATIQRRKGIAVKLARTGTDSRNFQQRFWEHVHGSGMDSITYVCNPSNPADMVCIIFQHEVFSDVSGLMAAMRFQLQRYDDYDWENNRDAVQCLINSLDDNLRRELRSTRDDNEPFPITWMRVLLNVRSTSAERFTRLKNQLQTIFPTKYPGENIQDIAQEVRELADELSQAGQYDHYLTLTMVNNFLMAGDVDNETYRFPPPHPQDGN